MRKTMTAETLEECCTGSSEHRAIFLGGEDSDYDGEGVFEDEDDVDDEIFDDEDEDDELPDDDEDDEAFVVDDKDE